MSGSPQFFQRVAVKEALEHLAATDGSLTFFCGAGTSIDAGLPAWDQLITDVDNLLCQQIKDETDGGSELTDAFHDRHLVGTPLDQAALARARFAEASQRSLLSGPDLGGLLVQVFERSVARSDALAGGRRPVPALAGGLGETVRAVVTLYLAARERWDRAGRAGSPPVLVTQNYDLLLEAVLDSMGVQPVAVARDIDDSEVEAMLDENRVPVIHLHGHVGYPADFAHVREQGGGGVVFDEHDYYGTPDTEAGWHDAFMCRRLSSSATLFVGSSLADPHLIEQLHRAQRPPAGSHVALVFRPGSSGSGWDDATQRDRWARGRKLLAARWRAVHVNPLSVEFAVQVAQFAFELGMMLRAKDPERGEFVPYGERLDDWMERLTADGGANARQLAPRAFQTRQGTLSQTLTSLLGLIERRAHEAELPLATSERLDAELWVRCRGAERSNAHARAGTGVTDLTLVGTAGRTWTDPTRMTVLSVPYEGRSDVVDAFRDQRGVLTVVPDANAVAAWSGTRLSIPLYANDNLGFYRGRRRESLVPKAPDGGLVGRMPLGVLVLRSTEEADSVIVRMFGDEGLEHATFLSDIASVISLVAWDLEDFLGPEVAVAGTV